MLTVSQIVCRIEAGEDVPEEDARLAQAKEGFLREFLKLEKGLPSHDTFSRLFRQLDPEQFGSVFQRFMERFSKGVAGVVAIDGKVV
ncbi:transposase family protein, partial [Aurantimonas sp. A2-1-M11]|uniref:transposase family protein n=1 Tax=Aurantimonas sp. A2-1-M11 TaxID=3113712 RepID=UPI003FA53268